MIFGYQRISTKGQEFNLQTDALKKYGCEKIFSDVASGAKASRPSLDNLISQLRAGDVIVNTAVTAEKNFALPNMESNDGVNYIICVHGDTAARG